MNEQRDLEGISALVTGASSGIGSMAGQVGLPGGAAYGATKGALAAMTRSRMRGTPESGQTPGGGHLDPRRTKTSPGLPGESGWRERAETALTGHVRCALADASAGLPASRAR